MKRYGNRSGQSGILAYEYGKDWIRVRWADGTYRYTAAKVGRKNVEAMKPLADAGEGLNTFINQHREVWEGAERIG